MRRPVSFLTTICLALWIMPLGAFIKPSQEKTACDGQRPLHMCCMMTSKVRTDGGASSRVNVSSASGVNAGVKSSAGTGNDFLLSKSMVDGLESQRSFLEFNENISYPLVLRSLEHVPKV